MSSADLLSSATCLILTKHANLERELIWPHGLHDNDFRADSGYVDMRRLSFNFSSVNVRSSFEAYVQFPLSTSYVHTVNITETCASYTILQKKRWKDIYERPISKCPPKRSPCDQP